MSDYFPYESVSKSDHTIIPTEQLPSEQRLGVLEPVAYFNDAMPTGVTVSQKDGYSLTFQGGAMKSHSR